jgi:phage RecT family recombinase
MAENTFLSLLEKEKPNILAMLPKLNDWLTEDRWWATAYEIAKSKDLTRIAQNNPMSIVNALKRIASWGLDLDGEECLIIPYGEEAQAQTMYKGLIRRAVEGGAIAHAVADIIRDGDQVEIISSTRGRELVHRPAFGTKGKREIIGAYALFTLPNGLTDYELMDHEDLASVQAAALRMANRRKKPGEEAGESPAWRFFKGEMCKKSVLRRGLKRFRGKRDTAAGQLYNRVSDDDAANFDIDKVRKAEKANDDIATPPPMDGGRKVDVEVQRAPIDDNKNDPITEDEQLQILDMARGKGLKTPTALVKFINSQCDIAVEDLDSLKKGQVTKIMEALGA